MKLKLDLHPIYSDSAKIEASLNAVINEACEKRAAEVEIIPGKGSGALKKTVLRFLDRPEIKSRYQRVEKDSDNFGRVFVHFRWDKEQVHKGSARTKITAEATCFCCGMIIEIERDDEWTMREQFVIVECSGCGSPNKVKIVSTENRFFVAAVSNGYE